MPTVTVDVEVDIDDLAEQMGPDTLKSVCKRAGLVVADPGKGDIAPDRYIEEGFLAAEALPECPRAIRDLFWHVHGRAM